MAKKQGYSPPFEQRKKLAEGLGKKVDLVWLTDSGPDTLEVTLRAVAGQRIYTPKGEFEFRGAIAGIRKVSISGTVLYEDPAIGDSKYTKPKTS